MAINLNTGKRFTRSLLQESDRLWEYFEEFTREDIPSEYTPEEQEILRELSEINRQRTALIKRAIRTFQRPKHS
jgi:hypothetical protein